MKLKIFGWLKTNKEIIFEWAWFAVMTLGALYLLYWVLSYIRIDPVATGDYFSVVLPKIAVNVGSLCGIAWLFDLVTPGSYLRSIAENAYASAIFMSVLVLSLALLIM